eukprot:54536_1
MMPRQNKNKKKNKRKGKGKAKHQKKKPQAKVKNNSRNYQKQKPNQDADTSALMQQYNNMKHAIEEHKTSLHDQIPTGPMNRMMLIMRHNASLSATQSLAADEFMNFNTNSDPISCQFVSVQSQDELKTQIISELNVNQVSQNCKLVATTVTDCVQRVAVNTVIEDANHDVINLAIYNFAPLRSTKKELQLLLPIGTKLIIKEPYAKKSLDGSYNIRIDNPHSNLIVMKENDPKYIQISEQDPNELKAIGNEYFTKKMYGLAIRYYSTALLNIENESNDELKAKLLSNRSFGYLQMNESYKAAQDALHALELDKDAIKVVHRYATALANLRQYEKALDVMNNTNIKDIESKSIQKSFEQLKRQIECKLKESKQLYAMNHLMNRTDLEDIEDYISSSIAVEYINDVKGRGVVATEDIKKGQVILIEKCTAFGGVYPDKMCGMMDHRLNEAFLPSKVSLIQNIVDIYTNGKDIDKYKISLLYSGDKYSKNSVIVPRMELFKTDAFELKEDIPVLNIDQIRAIAIKNAFAVTMKPSKTLRSLLHTAKGQMETGSAIFVAGSFFNHSNRSNVAHMVNWRRIFVAAERNIRKGEELCVAYTSRKDATSTWF